MGNSSIKSSVPEQDKLALFRTLAQAQQFSVRVPDTLNFVWIGDCSRADFSYLSVWRRFNPHMTMQLWTDESSHFCHRFQHYLRKWSSAGPALSLCEIQNAAFEFIYSRVMRGDSFNTAALNFLQVNNIFIDESFFPDALRRDGDIPEGVFCRDINTLFENELIRYRKLYYYELILRGNFAAASDIIRLLVLYRYGGFYIDLDTLPEIDYLFNETKSAEKEFGIEDDERVCLAKSAAFIGWFQNETECPQVVDNYIIQIANLPELAREEIKSRIIKDFNNLCEQEFRSLGDIFVHPWLMLAGAVKFLPGTFFNNMMCSAPNARMIRLILKRIEKNYRYLERSKALFKQGVDNNDAYRSFLCGYRNNAEGFSDPVTLRLTGPGAIIDTLTHLFYRFTPEGSHLPHCELGMLLQKDEYGLTIKKQTMDTPMGLK